MIRARRRDSKRMLRLLIEDVTLLRDDVIQISIRWHGGATRKVECPLPLPAPDLGRTPAALVEQVRVLATEQTDGQIAETLNGRWLRSGCGLPFTSTRVRTLRESYDIDRDELHPPIQPAAVALDNRRRQGGLQNRSGKRTVCGTVSVVTQGPPWR